MTCTSRQGVRPIRQARRFRSAAIPLLLLALGALEGNARLAPRNLWSELEARIARYLGTTAESLLYPRRGEQLRGEDHSIVASVTRGPALATLFQQIPQRRTRLEASSRSGEATEAPGWDYAHKILTTDKIDQSWSIDNDARLLVSCHAHTIQYLIGGGGTAL